MMKMKWMGLATVIGVAMCLGEVRAAESQWGGGPPVPLLETSIALDRPELLLIYPTPEPFHISRGQVVTTPVFLHDAASAPDGGLAIGTGFGFGWASASSTSSPSLRAVKGLHGNAAAIFSAIDRFRIMPDDPALLGQPGRFTVTMLVEGHGQSSAPGAGGDLHLAKAWADASLSIARRPTDEDTISRSLFARTQWENGGVENFGAGFGEHTLTVDFVFGEMLDLYLRGEVGARAYGHGDQFAAASAQLTAFRWMGMSELTDLDGNPIGYSITSASGVDWSQAAPFAVPEPGAMLLLLGAGVLFQRRRAC